MKHWPSILIPHFAINLLALLLVISLLKGMCFVEVVVLGVGLFVVLVSHYHSMVLLSKEEERETGITKHKEIFVAGISAHLNVYTGCF